MEYIQVASSMIDLVGYDAEKKVLEIRYLASQTKYKYLNVPQNIYDDLLAATSKGTYMNAHIKDKYLFEKLN